MRLGLSSRTTHKWLALLLLLAAGACIWALCVAPLIGLHRSNKAAIEDRLTTLNRWLVHANGAKGLEDGRYRLAYSKVKANFLEGPSDALILAAMQNRIRTLVAQHSGTVIGVENITPTNENSLTRLGARFRLRVPFQAFHRLLFKIERSQPLLFVDRLTIHVDLPRLAASQQRPPQPFIVSSLDITGVVWPKTTQQNKSTRAEQ